MGIVKAGSALGCNRQQCKAKFLLTCHTLSFCKLCTLMSRASAITACMHFLLHRGTTKRCFVIVTALTDCACCRAGHELGVRYMAPGGPSAVLWGATQVQPGSPLCLGWGQL